MCISPHSMYMMQNIFKEDATPNGQCFIQDGVAHELANQG